MPFWKRHPIGSVKRTLIKWNNCNWYFLTWYSTAMDLPSVGSWRTRELHDTARRSAASLAKQNTWLAERHCTRTLDWMQGTKWYGLFFIASTVTLSDAMWFLPMRVHKGSYVPLLQPGFPELRNRIEASVATITWETPIDVWEELAYHYDVWHATNGAHIDHL